MESDTMYVPFLATPALIQIVSRLGPLPLQMGQFIPVTLVDIGGLTVALGIGVATAYELWKWRKVVPRGFVDDVKQTLGVLKLVLFFFLELLNRVVLFRDVINDSRRRRFAHYLVFWGFVATALATTLDFIYNRNAQATFLPAVLFGNAGGILLLGGGTIILIRRLSVKERILTARTSLVKRRLTLRDRLLADSSFLILLYLTTITGFSAEIAGRVGNFELTFTNYLVHLTFVALLFITAPFTHFFHAFLEPIMRYIGKIQGELTSKPGVNYKHAKVVEEMLHDMEKSQKSKSEAADQI